MVEPAQKEIKKLVKKAKSGDSEAFGLIYDHYLDRIYRFIFLKVSNKEEAEDLSQQVFMKAWEAMVRFEDEGLPFASWLYRIARNLVIDFYRTRKSVVSLEENILDELMSDQEDIEESVIRSQSQERIMEALKQLSDEQKDVIILRFVDDLSYREIARITQKNQAALRILHHRALKKLKIILEK